MKFLQTLATAVLFSLPFRSSDGQEAVAAPPYGATYKEIKTWHEQARSLDFGAAPGQRLIDLRNVIRARYGDQGLNSLFRNLEGSGAIDPMIPGVEANVRLTTADSGAVRKGALRTHLYATKLFHDSQFRLRAINQPTKTSLGATDKDIVYQHVATGTTGRIEVKDIAAETQQANLQAYEKQLRKMAAGMKRTGELQTWINRKEIIPDLQEYGESLGIHMYGNVATGEQTRLKPGTKRIEAVYDELDRRHAVYGRVRIIEGSASVAFGVLLIYQSAPSALVEGERLFNPETRSAATGLQFGRDVSCTASGLALTAKGAALLAARLTTNPELLNRLATVGRVSGPLATVAFLVAEGFSVSQYAGGYITVREFTRQTAGLVGGAGGAAVGAWAGAEAGGAVGSLFGPEGTVIGAVIGGVACSVGGGYAGSAIAGGGVSAWFELQDARQAQELRAFIYERYGVTTGI